MTRLCDALLAMPHPRGGHLVNGVCQDCGRIHRWATVERYDMTKTAYDQHVTVARLNEDAYDGIQMGDVIAMAGGRAGLRWDATWGALTEKRYEFEIVSVEELPELIENARLQFEEWGRQAAAEQWAEGAWARAAESAGFYDDPRGD